MRIRSNNKPIITQFIGGWVVIAVMNSLRESGIGTLIYRLPNELKKAAGLLKTSDASAKSVR